MAAQAQLIYTPLTLPPPPIALPNPPPHRPRPREGGSAKSTTAFGNGAPPLTATILTMEKEREIANVGTMPKVPEQ